MSKFKNCFATAHELSSYTITIDGEDVATAHTLTALDRAEIEAKSTKRTFAPDGVTIDINSQLNILWTVHRALDSWILEEPLNMDNLSKHPMLLDLFEKIIDHEVKVRDTIAGNEKN